MSDYDNTNSGALFINNRKANENHSDFNGSVNVEGTEYWINAWRKTSKKGEKFMSLSVKRKNGQSQQREPGQDDDVPGNDDLSEYGF